MMSKHMVIAIDGPSGAGKSTIARALAAELGCMYVDTGALYRTVGYAALCRDIQPNDEAAVARMLGEITVELRHQDGEQHVYLNGEDVNGCIRTPQVSMAASAFSALPPVRRFLLDLQQDTARKQSVIMDGRDIGTVVLPFADVKIFLTASAKERARRRYLELQEKQVETTFDEVLRDMEERDYNDSHRATAPLKAADDAILINTDGITLEQSIALLKTTILQALEG